MINSLDVHIIQTHIDNAKMKRRRRFQKRSTLYNTLTNKTIESSLQCEIWLLEYDHVHREIFSKLEQAHALLQDFLSFATADIRAMGKMTYYYPLQLAVFHNHLKAIFRAVYGDEYMAPIMERFEERILELGYIEPKEFRTESGSLIEKMYSSNDPGKWCPVNLVIAPRQRWGKSISLQATMAMTFLLFDNSKAAHGSTSVDLSCRNLREVRTYLEKWKNLEFVANFSDRKIEWGSRIIVITTDRGFRGSNYKFIYIDEFGFCYDKLLTRLLAGIMTIIHRCFFFYTTPNAMSTQLDTVYNNPKSFKTVHVTKMCDICLYFGRSICHCNSYLSPDIEEKAEVTERLRVIFKSDQHAFNEEILGRKSTTDVSTFTKQEIQSFMQSTVGEEAPVSTSKTKMAMKKNPVAGQNVIAREKTLYWFCDPGETSSATATIVAVIDIYFQKIVIVHIDQYFNTATIDSDYEKHLGSILSHMAYRFPGHKIKTFIETRPSPQATKYHAKTITEMGTKLGFNVTHTTFKDKDNNIVYGFQPSEEKKFMGMLQLKLFIRSKKIAFDANVSTSTINENQDQHTRVSLREMALNTYSAQMLNLRSIPKSTSHISITGKESGNDDQAIISLYIIPHLEEYIPRSWYDESTIPPQQKIIIQK